MQIYLVGGAVRDQLMGLSIKERDWVVVGASPEELLALGFQPVGKDFPVFLHPITHEEYALARTERKTGKGYKGFIFYAAADVTLEQDLIRRDLTINAMAQTADGTIIDPFGGQKDLQEHRLRHVSDAFQEDPVRILRIARFAAKFPDFTVDPETNLLMENMVKNGEINALVAERVWQEFSRALSANTPLRFFEVLQNCQALPVLFPELILSEQTIHSLQQATEISHSSIVRFAALMAELSDTQINQFCIRYKVPREYNDLAKLVNNWLTAYTDILSAPPEQILKLLKGVDALRRPERFELFLVSCFACNNKDTSAQQNLLKKALKIIKAVDIQSLLSQNLAGPEFAKALEQLQLVALRS